ncbi:MAG: hypothetical protein J6Y29_03270 [Clostridiales bacterium]|nr:hypothetical protein [Clostridiales bacterium]
MKKGKLILILISLIVVLLVFVGFAKDRLIKIPTFKDFKMEELCIYAGDTEGESLIVDKVIKVEGGKTTEDKVEVVISSLQDKFSDIELEVVNYENVMGKKVLVLDLKDKDKPVSSYLNAGSTGSRINLGIIVNSLLQNEKNMSNWIDGVKILVNGEASVEGEHVDLSEIFYKSKNKNIELQ